MVDAANTLMCLWGQSEMMSFTSALRDGEESEDEDEEGDPVSDNLDLSPENQWLLQRIPAHRFGVPDDLVSTALLLVSPASSYITGQLVAIDGGFLAGGSWDNP